MLLYVIMSFREKEVGSLQNGKGMGIGERDVLRKRSTMSWEWNGRCFWGRGTSTVQRMGREMFRQWEERFLGNGKGNVSFLGRGMSWEGEVSCLKNGMGDVMGI